MATHSSVLAWRIPGTAEPGGLSSTGSHRRQPTRLPCPWILQASGFLKAWAWKYTSCQLRELQGQARLKGTAHTGYECGEQPLGGALPQTKTTKQSFIKKGGFYSLKPHSLFPGPVITSYLPFLKRGGRCQSEGRVPD